MSCPICLENTAPETSTATLKGCGHEFCQPCLEGWILLVECTVSGPDPSCPKCRCRMSEGEIESVLKRPFQRKELSALPPWRSTTSQENQQDSCYEPDEFTRVYLETLEKEGSARRCPSCRVWVTLESGCENVMCRCGCRFCFCCGRRGACLQGYFYDNIRGEEERKEFMGRQIPYEEAEEFFIDPLFQGDYWDAFVEYEEKTIEPLFQSPSSWDAVWTEYEESRLAPLFEGDWNWPGYRSEPAHKGMIDLAAFLDDVFLLSPEDAVWECREDEDGSAVAGLVNALGAGLFE